MKLTVEHVLMFVLVFCAFYYLKDRCECKEGLRESLAPCSGPNGQACFDSKMLKLAYTQYMNSRTPQNLQGLLEQVNTSAGNTHTQCC